MIGQYSPPEAGSLARGAMACYNERSDCKKFNSRPGPIMEPFALLPGSLLHERYNIERIILEDGPVLEYMALDVASGARHRIRHVHAPYSDVAVSRKKRQGF